MIVNCHIGAENWNLGPLEKQSVFLTTKPAPILYFEKGSLIEI